MSLAILSATPSRSARNSSCVISGIEEAFRSEFVMHAEGFIQLVCHVDPVEVLLADLIRQLRIVRAEDADEFLDHERTCHLTLLRFEFKPLLVVQSSSFSSVVRLRCVERLVLCVPVRALQIV